MSRIFHFVGFFLLMLLLAALALLTLRHLHSLSPLAHHLTVGVTFLLVIITEVRHSWRRYYVAVLVDHFSLGKLRVIRFEVRGSESPVSRLRLLYPSRRYQLVSLSSIPKHEFDLGYDISVNAHPGVEEERIAR